MGREHLENRANWQSEAGARGQVPEKLFSTMMELYFSDSPLYRAVSKPKDLKGIYGAKKPLDKPHGIIPDCAIKNLETGKQIFVEIKRQRAAGNAHERACKYFAPGIVKSAQEIALQPKAVFPFWMIFSNGIAHDPRYRQEIEHWFQGYERHLFFWEDFEEWKPVIACFETHIRPLMD